MRHDDTMTADEAAQHHVPHDLKSFTDKYVKA
jgi:hypothetical protein